MRKLMDSLDMTGNEIINVSMQKITSFPTDNLFTGRLIYLESESEETPSGYYYYNGEDWVSIGGGSGDEKSSIVMVETLPDNEGILVNNFEDIDSASQYSRSNNNPKNIVINTNPNITNIGSNAFANTTSIVSVIINDGITSIGNNAFSNCTSLTSITIPNSVTSIGASAFADCTSLTSVNIPNSVTNIGEIAFSGCTSLISITIPNSVTSIGNSTFSGCTFESVTMPTRLIDSIVKGGAYTKEIIITKEYGVITGLKNELFQNYTPLKSIIIPSNVTSIGNNVFNGCTSLTSITIPSSVTSIGNNAFSNCTSLTSITIPNSVTSIGTGAFSGCTSLTGITISSNITSINSSAFQGCTSLISITIPNKVTSIGYSAFYGCTSLTSITISSNITSINSSAFQGCTSLTSITIPNKVTSINSNTFQNCTSLTSINMSNVTSIGYGAFIGCTSLTSVGMANVTGIDMYAFQDCTSLTSINMSRVTSIGYSAFYGCTSLTSITIPSVNNIGNYAFSNCTSLTSVSIPGRFINTNLFNIIPGTIEYLTVTSGSSSGNTSFPAIFKNNTYIKNIVINSGSGITSIGNGAFQNCTSLTSVSMSSVTSIDIGAFSGCTSLTNITIPNSVTSIGGGAFQDCTSLTSINIPSSVTSIGGGAFQGCTSLTSVTINANTTNIKSGTFASCTALENVSIGSYITTIESGAFQNCTSLTSITIPNNVTTISSNAFGNCTSLKSITINNTTNSINIAGTVFAGLNSLNSVTIKGNATLGSYVFAGCSNLKSVYIDNVTEIGNGMFSGCVNLSYISMKKATTISAAAFTGCSSLKSITIPNTVTSIDSTAFQNCDIMALEPYKTSTGYPWGATDIYIQNEDVTTTIDQNSTDRQVPTAKAIYNFIRPIFEIRYGFRINKNNSDPDTRVEYLYDAVGMTPAKMTYDETTHKGTFDYGSWGNVWFIKNNRPVKLNFNGTVEAELNPNNYWETVDGQDSELETSTNCNFMSEIPIVYVKRWEDENYNYVVVCDKQYDEDYLAYTNTDKDGNLKPLYAPMFKGYKDSNNILRSIAGVDPMNSTTTSNEVMYSNNINTSGSVTGWQIEDVAKHELISDLLTLISKNTDSQTVFGNGVCQTSTRVFTGYNEIVTNTKTVKSDCGQFCGYNDNVHHVNIFHIQDFWGNRFDRCLGLITSGGKYYYKMTPENGGYVYSETITDYTNNGYNIAQDYSSSDITPPASSYIKNQSTGIFGNLPNNTTGASDSTYYCDYYSYNSSGVRLLLLGGNYGRVLLCGSRCFNVSLAPSLADVSIGASPFYV